MCTLTFVPNLKSPGNFILTSNRDEAPNRKTIAPKIYHEQGVEMCYPKDALAGGTWIGASSRKRLVCLLNGGFGRHERLNEYRKSRGLIVKELLASQETVPYLKTANLDGIEPFTLVSVDWNKVLKLHQLIWDGKQKHLEEIPVSPRIWSAPMLYSEEIKLQREKLFREFIVENRNGLGEENLMEFHKKFQIDRGMVKTTSITQFVQNGENSKMIYKDLLSGKTYTQPFSGL